MASDETRTRLMDEAERLFLAKGYDGVSVRAVNAAAGVNPAAVHYHFGTKDDLVVALLQRRLAPLWSDRLGGLTRRRDEGWTPDVPELVGIVVEPLDDLARDPDGRVLLHLLARIVLNRSDLPWNEPWFRVEPWCDLLAAARPDLTADEVRDRWMLAFGLVLQLYGRPLADRAGLAASAHAMPPKTTVVAFVSAGLAAPAVTPPSPEGPAEPLENP